eukprot:1760809-Prymnesium_polylepis.1
MVACASLRMQHGGVAVASSTVTKTVGTCSWIETRTRRERSPLRWGAIGSCHASGKKWNVDASLSGSGTDHAPCGVATRT